MYKRRGWQGFFVLKPHYLTFRICFYYYYYTSCNTIIAFISTWFVIITDCRRHRVSYKTTFKFKPRETDVSLIGEAIILVSLYSHTSSCSNHSLYHVKWLYHIIYMYISNSYHRLCITLGE